MTGLLLMKYLTDYLEREDSFRIEFIYIGVSSDSGVEFRVTVFNSNREVIRDGEHRPNCETVAISMTSIGTSASKSSENNGK